MEELIFGMLLEPVVEARLFETLLEGGVAALLAALMFFFYRKDSKEWTRRWEEAAKDERAAKNQIIQVVKENTVAITSLSDELRRRGGDS